MLRLTTVTGHLVRPEHAAAVIAPPYDALTVAQRREVVRQHADSYLGALPPGPIASDTERDAALARCVDHLRRAISRDRFLRFDDPSLLLMEIESDTGRSVAILGDVDVDAYRDGTVLPHEAIRDARVADLARYLEVVRVASSPVAVVQAASEPVDAATAAVRRRHADVTLVDPTRGERLSWWRVDDPHEQRRLARSVAGAGQAYIADGHHRAAAVAAVADAHDLPTGHPGRRVLTAVVPWTHLSIRPFHRTVDLRTHGDVAVGLRRGDPSDLTAAGFTVRELADAEVDDVTRVPAGSWRLCVAGRWWHVEVPGDAGSGDPVAALDVVRAERCLTVLGVPDGAAQPVPPSHVDALQRPDHLGVALPAPSWSQVRAVAAAGRTVPPKTTYLVPKLRSGAVVVPRPSLTS